MYGLDVLVCSRDASMYYMYIARVSMYQNFKYVLEVLVRISTAIVTAKVATKVAFRKHGPSNSNRQREDTQSHGGIQIKYYSPTED